MQNISFEQVVFENFRLQASWIQLKDLVAEEDNCVLRNYSSKTL